MRKEDRGGEKDGKGGKEKEGSSEFPFVKRKDNKGEERKDGRQ